MPRDTNAPSSGERPGKTPPREDERDDDEAPATPTDEPVIERLIVRSIGVAVPALVKRTAPPAVTNL